MLNLNIAVLSFGIFQSALLSIALLKRKREHPANIYMILFLVVIGMQLMFKVISKAWLWEHARTVYMISYNYAYLVGPLIYLYFRAQRGYSLFKKHDLLHFIPFAVYTCLTIADEEFGVIYDPLGNIIPWSFRLQLSLAGYAVASWMLSEQGNRSMKQFLVAVFSIEVVIVCTVSYIVQNISTAPDLRIVFILLTVLIYWITYKFLISPNALWVSDRTETFIARLVPVVTQKYANSGLQPEDADRIVIDFQKLIDKELFADPGLNIEQVAKTLSVSKHHLSQVINQRFNRTFTELVSNWRLAEAKRRLADTRYRHEKVSAIAFDLGFSSVSVFTTMFKKRFHITPSAFRNQSLSLHESESRHAEVV